MDLTSSIVPKSDQLNSDDLLAGPITVTVERVTVGNAEQPVNIHLTERPGRPYRPSKSMRRVLVMAWGKESDTYPGKRLTLYRNPDIKFRGEKVGGIEVSHVSGIDKPIPMSLTVTRGQKRVHTVQPLPDEASTSYTVPNMQTVEECREHYATRQAHGATEQELHEIASLGRTLSSQGADALAAASSAGEPA